MSDTGSAAKDIAARIDSDLGLKAKARLLTFTSLLLITIMVTGARIEEANTFVFKIIVSNQSGVPALLVLSIIFLSLRYYSYAKPYHSKIENIWSSKLLQNPFYLTFDYHSDEPSGIVYDLQPNGFGIGDPSFGNNTTDRNSFSYRRGMLLNRYLDYYWERENTEGEFAVSLVRQLGFRDYLKALTLEYKYRLRTVVSDREYLDILGPYFVGLAALVSFFWSSDVQVLLNMLTSSS